LGESNTTNEQSAPDKLYTSVTELAVYKDKDHCVARNGRSIATQVATQVYYS